MRWASKEDKLELDEIILDKKDEKVVERESGGRGEAEKSCLIALFYVKLNED